MTNQVKKRVVENIDRPNFNDDAKLGKNKSSTWGRDSVSPIGYFAGKRMDSSAIFWTFVSWLPKPSKGALLGYLAWVLYQGIMYAVIPGNIGYGQRTPAGHLLPYKVNGLTVYIITHVLYVAFSYAGIIDPAVIAKNWGGLFIAANIFGYFLTFFAYAKAYLFPSHPEDRKFSGSATYDLFMGIEFNPRLGELWDFKLFFNGRPGIVAWTLIDLSFAALQYQRIGYVTNSMILVTLVQATYVIDFFYNEDWYLRTIDIAHDHFGYYLAWGDCVWLPFMYTLQAQYLSINPVDLPMPLVGTTVVMAALGYYIFRGTNFQKDIVRSTDGNCMIWGKPAEVIRTVYTTTDGKTHTSLLLCSGFWGSGLYARANSKGLARQFNYVGDLLMSMAMCLPCGFSHLLPYFYIIYMYILLNHRILRSEKRCRAKYGKYWDMYCQKVKWKLCPGLY